MEFRFGATVVDGGVRFCLHAPVAQDVRLLLHDGTAPGEQPMARDSDGLWELLVPGARAGLRYSYRVDHRPARPDPASRFQPLGVHGPSEVVDHSTFAWSDSGWRGVRRQELVVYELHVGTFSPAGTFRGAIERLPDLRDLGVTAIELMPIADFAGDRNWGYDGVSLFAPSRAYGRPDDFRALVDRAHALGIAVILDVVYNHLGPEGAYLAELNPQYLTTRHSTPWGAAVNLDGPGCCMVRRFIMENAAHWVREYHVDGLRFDATHALIDTNPTHFMRELARAVRTVAGRPVVLHAEDHRNLDNIVRNDGPCAWGLDGVWADDFHHVLRSMAAGDEHSYYADFQGTTDELARTIRQGWLYTGETSRHLRTPRGTDPSAVPMHKFVVCIQNHDQVGNRAFGERLNHQVDPATWRALSVVLLTAPMTPLLFMGQEWSASSPFQFFTDLEPELGRQVTEGRRREFRDFPEFSTPDARERIPDPQSPCTFARSKLRWEERDEPAHAAALALYRRLLALRRAEGALQGSSKTSGNAFAIDADTIAVRRCAPGRALWIIARLRGAGCADLEQLEAAKCDAPGTWETILTTEDASFVKDAAPAVVTMNAGGPAIEFSRPGAVIFRVSPPDR